MSASNTDVVETLGLNIRVNLSGKKKLENFRKELSETQPILETFTETLSELTGVSELFNISGLTSAIRTLGKAISKTTVQAQTSGMALQPAKITYDNLDTDTSTKTYQTGAYGGNIPDTSTLIRMPGIFDRISQTASSASNAISRFGKSLSQSTLKAVNKFSEKLQGLVKSFGRIALYRSLRTIMKKITEGFTTGIQDLARYSEQFNSAMSTFATSSLYFKNAIGTLVAPIIEWAIPYFQAFIDKVVELINVINQYVAVLNGSSTFTKAKQYQVDYAKSLDSTSQSASKLKRQLMGFDEINMLQDNSTASSDGADYSSMFTTEATPISDEMTERVRKMKENIEGILGEAFLVIGGILCATGNIPLGVACLALGVKITAASINWSSTEKNIKKVVSNIEKIVGAALLVIGAILTFAVPTQRALGIGLMVAGAVTLASGIALNWDGLPEKIGTVCGYIAAILSGALLVIGMILALSNTATIPLGVALVAVGAAGLAASIGINWDSMSEKIQTILKYIIGIASGCLLALGLIMIGVPAYQPLAIALIIAGAAGLVGTVAMNWDWLSEKVSSIMDDVNTKAKEGLAKLKDKFTNWKASLKMPHVSWVEGGWTATGLVKKALETFNLPTSIPKPKVEWYAQGGFPETGQMFIARESGPELVGSMGNRNVVANNQQITDGIAQATYQAFKQAISESTSSSGSQDIYIDGEKVFSVIKKRNDTYTKMYGMSPLTSY